MTLNDTDEAIEKRISMYNGALLTNPALLQIVRSSVWGLERFSPSNLKRFCPPATAA
jgi:hypothetical protein